MQNVPAPPVLRPSGHPQNPMFVDGVPHIKVDGNGIFDRNARARPAVEDPEHPGSYKLAPNGGRRRKTKRRARRSRRRVY
jgi:hypothetical protein